MQSVSNSLRTYASRAAIVFALSIVSVGHVWGLPTGKDSADPVSVGDLSANRDIFDTIPIREEGCAVKTRPRVVADL